MSTTDALKRAVADQLEALRPVIDGARKPNGFRIHVRLGREGKMAEMTVEPAFKVYGEREL